MLATMINAAAVLLGGLAGLLLKNRIREDYRDSVSTAVGLVTLVLGMSMALDGGTILLVVPALVIGGLIGTALGVERGILKMGEGLKRVMSPNEEGGAFARGFLDASVLFCVGPMTVIGSLEAGLRGNYDVLLTKSALDAFMAIILAAVSGVGVLASIVTILVIQGGLTLLAGVLSPLATEAVLAELGALGGFLILMIGLNLLDLKKVKTANFLPAIVIVILLAWARDFFGLSGGILG